MALTVRGGSSVAHCPALPKKTEVYRIVLRILDSVLFCPRDPGWAKYQDPDLGSGSGMNIPVIIPDIIIESLETIFGVKNT